MPAELAARCRNGSSTPSPAATATAAWNSASAAASSSGEASARCDHRPAMRSRPASSASRAALTSAGQSSGLAPFRCRPVSTLRCTAAGVAPHGVQDAVELTEGRHPQFDIGVDRGGEVRPLTVEPREQRHLDPRRAQRDPGRNLEHGQRARAALDRSPSERQHPVPVRIRLDGDHAPGRRDQLGERPHVVAERSEIEDQHRSGSHAPPASRLTREPRPAVRSSGSRSVAVAHSCALGTPVAGSPNRMASLPSSGTSSPQSTTN